MEVMDGFEQSGLFLGRFTSNDDLSSSRGSSLMWIRVNRDQRPCTGSSKSGLDAFGPLTVVTQESKYLADILDSGHLQRLSELGVPFSGCMLRSMYQKTRKNMYGVGIGVAAQRAYFQEKEVSGLRLPRKTTQK